MDRFGRSLSMNQINQKCEQCLRLLKNNRAGIIKILLEVETLSMAEDELFRGEDLLLNINAQSKYLSKHFSKSMATFLPLNQPLYSYLLQVFLPSLILERVFYRPPAAQLTLYNKLNDLFCDLCCNVELCGVSRRIFVKEFVNQCDVVNFTGKYDNVIELIEDLPKNVSVIYNGSAINPIIVGEDADVACAAKDSVVARLYNSGQDCMAPACIFVDKRISEQFIQCVVNELQSIRVGNDNEHNDIGPQLEEKSIEEFKSFLDMYGANVIYGGTYDEDALLIYPTIFYFDSCYCDLARIYYAPCLFVITYQSICEIQQYLDADFCQKYAGYISLYGACLREYVWKSKEIPLVPLYNQTLFSAEDGNTEFGGYGKGCNFVMTDGKFAVKPILILRELFDIFSED